MGVDFYNCKRCGEIYADCGYYVTCSEDAGGCGRDWCSIECAEEEGYKECSCKQGKDVDNGYTDEECEHLPEDSESCYDCEYFIKASCSHCRKEMFDDSEILEYALELLGKTKDNLVFELKNNIKSEE